MKRNILVYGLLVCVVVFAAVLSILLGNMTPTRSALSKLGKGEGLYAEARDEILMSSGDALPALARYAADPRKSRRGRLQAMEILAEVGSHQQRETMDPALQTLLADTSQVLRDAALKVYRSASDTTAIAPLLTLLRAANDSAGLANAYRALCASAAVLTRRVVEGADDRNRALLDSAIARVWDLPINHLACYPRAARYLESTGDSAAARRLRDDLGLVPQWWTIGPFPIDWVNGTYRNMGPDTVPFDSRKTFSGKDGAAVQWRMAVLSNADCEITHPLQEETDRSTYFLFTWVVCPEASDALLYLGIQHGARVWWNSAPVFTWGVLQSPRPDEVVVGVRCLPGPNALLVRFDRYLDAPILTVRIAGRDGHALKDARFTLDTLRAQS